MLQVLNCNEIDTIQSGSMLALYCTVNENPENEGRMNTLAASQSR